MKEYVINSSHPSNKNSTPLVNGGALVIFWSPAVLLSTFKSCLLHVDFRNRPKSRLKIFLNPSASECSIVNYSSSRDIAYHTFPWPDRHPIVIIKHDDLRVRSSDCTILASDSQNRRDEFIRAIPIDIDNPSLKFESISIYTRIGLYGNDNENCKVTGPFTVTVFGGEAAAAEAKFYAMELHAERLAKNRISEQGAASGDYETRLKEREQDVSAYRNALDELDQCLKVRENIVLGKEMALGDRETNVSDRERRVSNREVEVVDRERIVADRERRVAQREHSVSERTQEANLGQGQQDGSDKVALSQGLGNHPEDYDEMEVAVNAWPTAVMLVLGGKVAVGLKKKYQRLMDDWVNARGGSLSPDAYDYLVYSHGVAWPKLIPEDKFLAVRTAFKELTK